MSLSGRHVRLAAYVIGEEVKRRRLFGHPTPPELLEVHHALQQEMTARGHETSPAVVDPSRWKTTDQLAAQWHCSPRTVRRRAAAAGARKIHNRWLFCDDPEDT